MRSLWRVAVLAGVSWAVGCSGVSGSDPGANEGSAGNVKFAACTEAGKCCSEAEQVTCVGDPDSVMKCSCQGLWNCDLNQKKCQQPTPVPPGDGTWTCTWSEASFSCSRSVPRGTDKGQNPQDLPGGSSWACKFNDVESRWQCTRSSVPNPSNQPGGTSVWDCTVLGAQLVCERTDSSEQPPPEGGTGQWKCETVNGKTVCTKLDENGGLPPGGSDWKCNLSNIGGVPTWTCYGTSTSNPAGASGWTCTKVNELGAWRCSKPNDSSDVPGGSGTSGGTSGSGTSGSGSGGTGTGTGTGGSSGSGTGTGTGSSGTGTGGSGGTSGTSGSGGEVPPGGGYWACVKGSEFGGTTCESVPTQPTPPSPTGKPPANSACVIGDKMWCDGLQYCGWGQVVCDPATGKWKTRKNSDGQEILDCQELDSGARPNTTCACYHFYFNPVCCERPDCIVPPGSNGQVCPASKGGLCDYCNPQKPECKDQGAKCILTSSHETFCGRSCSTSNPCPATYQCMPVKVGGQTITQCVPIDLSCYF